MDGGNARVQKFDSNGNFLLKWSLPVSTAIAVGPDGFVYTNYGNASLAKWDTSGVLQFVFGSGLFGAARGMAFDSAGSLYVRDVAMGTLWKFNPATGAGLGLVISSGIAGSGGVAIDSHDRLHLATSATVSGVTVSSVKVFSTSGSLLAQWGSHCDLATGTGCADPDGVGPLELGDGQFKFAPTALWISNEFIYAGDTFNRRVQKFHLVFTPTVSACAQSALDALGLTVEDLSLDVLMALEGGCSAAQTTTLPPNETQGGGIRLNPDDVMVLGTNSQVNGTTQTTVEGTGSGTLFLGAGATINGSIKNIGTVIITGPGVTISGSLTGIGTLYYLPGATLSVGGATQVTTTIQL
jgi:hypothetical protein